MSGRPPMDSYSKQMSNIDKWQMKKQIGCQPMTAEMPLYSNIPVIDEDVSDLPLPPPPLQPLNYSPPKNQQPFPEPPVDLDVVSNGANSPANSWTANESNASYATFRPQSSVCQWFVFAILSRILSTEQSLSICCLSQSFEQKYYWKGSRSRPLD
ncbi:unnamed protein product [Oppiella nova]|uniref:Uncharacterized protein n=1 Tax=Oppiella nova TaxID=334625 RepID=A0A7R9QGW6_9ACAR|nr:unnamed protein product [Oppiella nova]CAG2164764.1 unnamed protein product [Oppiella nova]